MTAFDREDGTYRAVGKGIHRCGWSSGDTFTDVFVKSEDGGFHPKRVLHHGAYVEDIEQGVGADGTWYYNYDTSVTFHVMGEEVDHEYYYAAASAFDARMMEITETAMVPLYWRDFEADTQAELAVLVAEVLLSSKQEFVKPSEN